MRPLLVRLPPGVAIRLYSRARIDFLRRFVEAKPRPAEVPAELERTLWPGTPWECTFRGPLWNAAGMFKDGRGYRVVAASGAGAFLAGTTTASSRVGNRKDGVRWPFAPYPRSGAASNWMGLPNPGHAEVARRLASLERVAGCPVGASVSLDPGDERPEEAKIDDLAEGVARYAEAGVDFVELNESCPNTEDGAGARDDLAALRERLRRLFDQLPGSAPPVVVKLSVDLDAAALPAMVDVLVEAGCAGLDVGNTSVDRATLRAAIEPEERALFDRFAQRYGGGLSGRPLKQRSLALASAAADYARAQGVRDFVVWRTGGVETAHDLRRTLDAGIDAAQWYTGYFEAFSRLGWGAYPEIWSGLREGAVPARAVSSGIAEEA